MELTTSLEAISCSAIQEILGMLRDPTVHYYVQKKPPPLPAWARQFQLLRSFQTKLSCATFRNLLAFYGKKFWVLRPAPKSEAHPCISFGPAYRTHSQLASIFIARLLHALHEDTSNRNLISFIIFCSSSELKRGYFRYVTRQNSEGVQQSHLTNYFFPPITIILFSLQIMSLSK